MDDEIKLVVWLVMAIAFTTCFVTWQTQNTNRQYIEKGYSYTPVERGGYSMGWVKAENK